MKTDLGKSEKAKAIVHLVIVALVLIGLVVCGVRVFSGSGKERSRKHDRHAWNDSYKDHRERERNWPSVFGDLQETQLQAAIKNGVRGTVTRENVETLGMVQIGTNDLYKLDRLTHSVPWVVPKMASLLDDIGKAFQDSLYRRGYNRHHRIIVTSVTRTAEDVKRLSQQNVNATENSCHCYGTTIDITYVRYDKPEEHAASNEKLRSLLMQTVYDLREQKRCYVKFERKQSCLHITVR